MAHRLDGITDKNICVLGGGQLGRMMALDGARLGLKLTCLDPSGENSSAAPVCSVMKGDFNNYNDVMTMQGDVFTVEIEHVNVEALEELERQGKSVNPAPESLRIISDKLIQKQTLAAHGVPMGKFKEVVGASRSEMIHSIAYIADEHFGYPMMLKARKLAYDGRGNAVVDRKEDIAEALEYLGPAVEHGGVYVESWVPFQAEISCIVARDRSGNMAMYDVVETRQADNICRIVVAPPSFPFPAKAKLEAERVARLAVSALRGAGVFAVEMFYLGGDKVFYNEIAPRPHNSGHLSIEACVTSQFEQHLRCVANLPLGDTSMRVGAAAMVNILGASTEAETLESVRHAMTIPGCKVHWYDKGWRAGRKLGHITITAPTMTELRKRLVAIGEPLDEEDCICKTSDAPVVGVIMGSDSDLPTMKDCAVVLEEHKIPYEIAIVSAHRTPERMYEYAKNAKSRGIRVIVAGAGGAAHLPGMVAALTPLPVIGVPIKTSTLNGQDSLLSIVQMPGGIPVATVAIGNAKNAGLLAVRMIAACDPSSPLGKSAGDSLEAFHESQRDDVLQKTSYLESVGHSHYLQEYRSTDPTYRYMPKIYSNISKVLDLTNIKLPLGIKEKYVGKVRDRYDDGKHVVLITTDRLTAFDRPIALIPFKGQVLNLISLWWFEKTKHIIKNQLIPTSMNLQANITIARRCKTFPIEFVMRGYIAGSSGTSLWTHYSKGVRRYCGFDLPDGLVKNQKLSENLCTPTTKSDEHDELIDSETIVRDGWMSQEDWDFCSKRAYELFAFGQKTALEHGLILVDTKYEFGRDLETGEILLIDEIHTPDCSRYWIADTYDECMKKGVAPEHIDKEFIRLWYTQHCDPYKDEVIPVAPSNLVCELSRRYLFLYEKITGKKFHFVESSHSINEQIQMCLNDVFA